MHINSGILERNAGALILDKRKLAAGFLYTNSSLFWQAAMLDIPFVSLCSFQGTYLARSSSTVLEKLMCNQSQVVTVRDNDASHTVSSLIGVKCIGLLFNTLTLARAGLFGDCLAEEHHVFIVAITKELSR